MAKTFITGIDIQELENGNAIASVQRSTFITTGELEDILLEDLRVLVTLPCIRSKDTGWHKQHKTNVYRTTLKRAKQLQAMLP